MKGYAFINFWIDLYDNFNPVAFSITSWTSKVSAGSSQEERADIHFHVHCHSPGGVDESQWKVSEQKDTPITTPRADFNIHAAIFNNPQQTLFGSQMRRETEGVRICLPLVYPRRAVAHRGTDWGMDFINIRVKVRSCRRGTRQNNIFVRLAVSDYRIIQTG